jgi:hypothetical protein
MPRSKVDTCFDLHGKMEKGSIPRRVQRITKDKFKAAVVNNIPGNPPVDVTSLPLENRISPAYWLNNSFAVAVCCKTQWMIMRIERSRNEWRWNEKTDLRLVSHHSTHLCWTNNVGTKELANRNEKTVDE